MKDPFDLEYVRTLKQIGLAFATAAVLLFILWMFS